MRTMRVLFTSTILPAALVSFVACSNEPEDDGSDETRAASVSYYDAGKDVQTDADADADAGHDAGNDAGHDAGNDAGHDAGKDAGHDAGKDAGNDAGKDSGRPW